jgi:hypothetical protein
VKRRGELVTGIGRLVRKPATEIVGVAEPFEQDRLRRADRPDRVHERLHADRRVGLGMRSRIAWMPSA